MDKIKDKLNAIREFAKQMGYKIEEREYTHCDNKRPLYSIELIGTWDSEGYPYSWVWYLDTGEETWV